ncbi:MAG: ROK family protein [Chloroflexi bacterium]|nr:ROK family protein [Chloroflexota bacterium]
MASYIAVDVGGTNIRAARYTPDGQLLARAHYDTPTHSGAAMERIIAAITDVMPDPREVRAIGIGAPGPLDPKTGIVLRAPNLPGWEDFPLRETMEKRFGLPTTIGNDANMAAMGEWKFGAGRGHDDVLYLTISTGIGGGVISGGRLVVGARGLATELGHVTVAPDGPVCGCGQRGHLEALASGPAIGLTARIRLHGGAESKITEMVGGEIDSVTAKHVGMAALAGDEFAIGLLNEAGTYIGRAIADFLHMFNPSIVILGGGVAINVGDPLFRPARKAMQQRWMGSVYDCAIVPAQLGDDVGLLGTLALAMETYP